jgi:cardiolipin synthase
MTYTVFGVAAIALQVLAVVFILRSIKTARTSQGAVAWAFFLFFLPFLAVPFYLFLGNWRYSGYVVARRASKKVIARVRQQEHDFGATNLPASDLEMCFEGIAALPIVRGNKMTLLTDWREVFDEIFQAIDSANDYVLVQFYIIQDDDRGNELKSAMRRAALRGVTVRLLYDAVGSKDLTRSYLADLSQAGVEVLDINRLFGPSSRFQINFRNHRKSVIVDGHIGFIGGYNVGNEYAGRSPKFGKWRDTHCALLGPIVTQLQWIFVEDWHGATGLDISKTLNWETKVDPADMNGLIVATGPADDMDFGAYYFCTMIQAAQSRVWITSPYLIAENDILAALKIAVLRGVEVRLLLPKSRDHWATWLAAFEYFDELRSVGVEVWLYDDGFMHQKVVLVDDRIASVGTINLDNRSCRLNFEATAVMFDKTAAKATEEMLLADFAKSHLLETPLDQQPFHIRYGAPIARLFAPIL